MYKILASCFFLAFVCFSVPSALDAQNARPANFSEGQVSYGFVVHNAPEVESYLKGSSLTATFLGQSSKFDWSFIGGLVRVQMIYQEGQKHGILLLDLPMFGEKTAIRLDSASVMEQLSQGSDVLRNQAPQIQENQEMPQLDWKEEPKKRKRIAKHKCKKHSMDIGELTPQAEGMNFALFISQKFRPDMRQDIQNMIEQFDGFPLGMEFSYNDMRIELLAKDIDKSSVSPKSFEIPSDYTEKTLEEFKSGFSELLGTEDKDKTIGL